MFPKQLHDLRAGDLIGFRHLPHQTDEVVLITHAQINCSKLIWIEYYDRDSNELCILNFPYLELLHAMYQLTILGNNERI